MHLHAYSDEEAEAMLRRAAAVGVRLVVGVSVDPASAARTVSMAARLAAARGGSAAVLPGVVAAVGLHPARLRGMPSDEEWLEMERVASDPAVAAIGECGVDTSNAHTPGPLQLAVLSRHCRLAARLGKPLLLHLVGEELVGPALGTIAASKLPRDRAVAHYFQGDRFEANRLIEAGLLIAVGKPVTRPEKGALREAIRDVPLDALLLETDTYPLPGRTTEPRDVALVARAVADIKGLDADEIARTTTRKLERRLVRDEAAG